MRPTLYTVVLRHPETFQIEAVHPTAWAEEAWRTLDALSRMLPHLVLVLYAHEWPHAYAWIRVEQGRWKVMTPTMKTEAA